MTGRHNVIGGLIFLGFFMAYGFVLIYLRDFSLGKEQWIADYAVGKHFEARLAHVHGNLFAFLNILIGYLLLRFRLSQKTGTGISLLALTGMLMPLGIVAELLLGAPPLFVLIGAAAMIASVVWLGGAFINLKMERP